MKHGLLFILLIPFVSFCQNDSLLFKTLPLQEGKVTYTRIVEIKGANKNRLHTLIKEWGLNTYKSQKSALESEDKETGLIVYKGYFQLKGTNRAGLNKGADYVNNVFHTLKFFIKDEKVKIQLTDLATIGGYDDFVATMTKQVAQPRKIEEWYLEARAQIAKGAWPENKVERAEENMKGDAEDLNVQIEAILDGISASLQKNKSEFDF